MLRPSQRKMAPVVKQPMGLSHTGFGRYRNYVGSWMWKAGYQHRQTDVWKSNNNEKVHPYYTWKMKTQAYMELPVMHSSTIRYQKILSKVPGLGWMFRHQEVEAVFETLYEAFPYFDAAFQRYHNAAQGLWDVQKRTGKAIRVFPTFTEWSDKYPTGAEALYGRTNMWPIHHFEGNCGVVLNYHLPIEEKPGHKGFGRDVSFIDVKPTYCDQDSFTHSERLGAYQVMKQWTFAKGPYKRDISVPVLSATFAKPAWRQSLYVSKLNYDIHCEWGYHMTRDQWWESTCENKAFRAPHDMLYDWR